MSHLQVFFHYLNRTPVASLVFIFFLSACATQTEQKEEKARYIILNSQGKEVGESVIYSSAVIPGRLIEKTVIRDEDGIAVISINGSLEIDDVKTVYRVQSRLRRTVDTVEIYIDPDNLNWRRKKGLAVFRSEIPYENHVLLAWMIAIDDEPTESMLLWHNLSKLLAEHGPGESRMNAFNTRCGRSFDMFISYRESLEASVGNENRTVHRFFVSTHASGNSVWVDAENRELLMIEDGLGYTVRRIDFTAPKRKPESAPDSVAEDLLSLEREDVILSGTLTFPRDYTEGVPLVILIHGSGGMDRDESPFHVFRHMAHDLGEAGYAVFRYDKRGVAESRFTGDEKDMTLEALTSDVIAWLNILEQRKEIDAENIFVAGHSEGGYIGPLVASMDPRIKGVIMLAGPAEPLFEILEQQAYLVGRAHGMTEKELEEMVRAQSVLLRQIRSEIVPRDADNTSMQWLYSHYRHDSLAVLNNLETPLLAIFASGDIQVPVEQADILSEIAETKEAGQFEVIVLDGLDHVLMDDRQGRSGLGLLGDPDRRLDSRIPELIIEWIGKQL